MNKIYFVIITSVLLVVGCSNVRITDQILDTATIRLVSNPHENIPVQIVEINGMPVSKTQLSESHIIKPGINKLVLYDETKQYETGKMIFIAHPNAELIVKVYRLTYLKEWYARIIEISNYNKSLLLGDNCSPNHNSKFSYVWNLKRAYGCIDSKEWWEKTAQEHEVNFISEDLL